MIYSMLNELVQLLLVFLIAMWSLYSLLRQFMPTFVQQKQQLLAQWLMVQGWPKLAKYIEPTAQGGCGSGCKSCSTGCAAPSTEQVVRWSK